ncbi:hypothetical protein JCM5350_003815 [Sporobolomyces pararoseus]
MSDLTNFIYHEKQEPGSMMCLQHSINNLLQSELFSPASLADIARELDALESAQLDPGTRLRGEIGSQNVDESGFFSVQVAEKALEVLGLRLVRWGSEELAHVHSNPEQIEGFLLSYQLHWFSIRRFAPNRFYNLDSCIPEPTWISEMYLGLQLREFELKGYSIFAIVPSAESHIGGLPPCDASSIAPSLPPPSGGGGGGGGASSSSYASGSGSNSHIRFNGSGQTLGGGAASSSSTNPFSSGSNPTLNRTYSKGKRPASDEDDEDDDIIIEESGGPRTVSAGSSSVEEESEQRRRRRKIDDSKSNGGAANNNGNGNGQDMSEEDMMARAIEESLRVSRSGGETSANESAGGSGANSARPRSRAAEAEEEEFQRALQASLEGAQAEGKDQGEAMDEEEEDAPTMEELRARRLARFG